LGGQNVQYAIDILLPHSETDRPTRKRRKAEGGGRNEITNYELRIRPPLAPPKEGNNQ